MTTAPVGHARSRAGGPGGAGTIVLLTVLAVGLSVAFVLAPLRLAANESAGFADERDLIDHLRAAFVGYWHSGRRDFGPDLARVVDYWSRYHLAKAAIAALVLFVLVALGACLWRAFLRTRGLGAGQRGVLVSSGVLATTLAVFALVLVMVNVRGATVPFASLLSMLPAGVPDATFDQVRQGLAGYPAAGSPLALAMMVDDFARFHLVLALTAAIVAVILAALSAASCKWFAAASARRTRRLSASFGVVSAALALTVIVVAVANLTTVADPAPALLAFFDGGS